MIEIEIIGSRWMDPRDLAEKVRMRKAIVERKRQELVRHIFSIAPRVRVPVRRRCHACNALGHYAKTCTARS